MISYIFKNKIKNIFVAITSVFFLCISLKELRAYMIVGAWNDMTLKLISLIPYLLVFLYMVNLKNDYKLKHLLFPIAFAISFVVNLVCSCNKTMTLFLTASRAAFSSGETI